MDPDLVKIKDNDGNYLEAYLSDGCSFFSFPHQTSFKEHLRQIRHFPVRNDDIFLCAYPKAGTHWVADMMDMLLRGSPTYSAEHKGISIIDRYSDTAIADMTSSRVLDTHYGVQFLPREMFEKKPKVILAMKNLKDCCVSYYHTFHPIHYIIWFDYTKDGDKVINENILPVHNVNKITSDCRLNIIEPMDKPT